MWCAPAASSPTNGKAFLGQDGLFWSHYEKVQLLKRHGRTQDVAATVAFLASDEAAFITAAVLDVDGGAVVKIRTQEGRNAQPIR